MLKCEQVKPLLSEYIDGELSLWKMQMVRLHLKKCAECSHELALLKNTDHLLKLGQDEITTSEHFTEDVLKRVSVISQKERISVPFFQRIFNKVKTYVVWFRYSPDIKSHLGFVWKASFTLLFLMTLFGLFSLSSFYKPNSEKEQSSTLAQKSELGEKFIKVEFFQSNQQTPHSKKDLPSFGS